MFEALCVTTVHLKRKSAVRCLKRFQIDSFVQFEILAVRLCDVGTRREFLPHFVQIISLQPTVRCLPGKRDQESQMILKERNFLYWNLTFQVYLKCQDSEIEVRLER